MERGASLEVIIPVGPPLLPYQKRLWGILLSVLTTLRAIHLAIIDIHSSLGYIEWRWLLWWKHTLYRYQLKG